MLYIRTDATASTTRDGTGAVLTNVVALVKPARLHFGPEGQVIVTEILFDNGVNLAAGDYITILTRAGQPLAAARVYQASWIDPRSDVTAAYCLTGLT